MMFLPICEETRWSCFRVKLQQTGKCKDLQLQLDIGHGTSDSGHWTLDIRHGTMDIDMGHGNLELLKRDYLWMGQNFQYLSEWC